MDEDATVNFGIGYTLSGLTGQVLNDAGEGVAGVNIAIESRGKKWSATTEGDGGFFVPSLVAGDYTVQADEDSLPAGYSAGGFGEPQAGNGGGVIAGQGDFHRASAAQHFRTSAQLRSGGGPICSRERRASWRSLEPGLTAKTDLTGRYMFRDLAAGSYTVSVPGNAEAPTRTVRLGRPARSICRMWIFRSGEPSLRNTPAPDPRTGAATGRPASDRGTGAE